jgi:hypothetical protein
MADGMRQKYVRRPDRPVVAVQLSVETDGLVYTKWGGQQRAKQGDWLVDNDGDVYTVEEDVFARTYRAVDRVKNPGAYVKTTPVWAVEATTPGSVKTKEGESRYESGDFIVSNDPDGADSYAIARDKFHALYILAP